MAQACSTQNAGNTLALLEKQYKEHKAEFEEWKKENASACRRRAYKDYVTQFLTWEKEALAKIQYLLRSPRNTGNQRKEVVETRSSNEVAMEREEIQSKESVETAIEKQEEESNINHPVIESNTPATPTPAESTARKTPEEVLSTPATPQDEQLSDKSSQSSSLCIDENFGIEGQKAEEVSLMKELGVEEKPASSPINKDEEAQIILQLDALEKEFLQVPDESTPAKPEAASIVQQTAPIPKSSVIGEKPILPPSKNPFQQKMPFSSFSFFNPNAPSLFAVTNSPFQMASTSTPFQLKRSRAPVYRAREKEPEVVDISEDLEEGEINAKADGWEIIDRQGKREGKTLESEVSKVNAKEGQEGEAVNKVVVEVNDSVTVQSQVAKTPIEDPGLKDDILDCFSLPATNSTSEPKTVNNEVLTKKQLARRSVKESSHSKPLLQCQVHLSESAKEVMNENNNDDEEHSFPSHGYSDEQLNTVLCSLPKWKKLAILISHGKRSLLKELKETGHLPPTKRSRNTDAVLPNSEASSHT